MIQKSRAYPAAILGATALLLTACSSSGSSSATKSAAPDNATPSAVSSSAAPSSAAPSTPAAVPTPAAPSTPAGVEGAAPGAADTLTITGSKGGTFQFKEAACLGKKDTSGALTLTATGGPTGKAALIVTFDGSGEMSVLLTIGDAGDAKAVVWAGKSKVGAKAARTADTVTFSDLAMSELPDAVQGKASGALKCESTAALL